MNSNDDENTPTTDSGEEIKVSRHSGQKDSISSGKPNGKICEDNEISIRARTKTRERKRDPDKGPISERDQSNVSIYSDDYDDCTLSDRSSLKRSPSLSPPKEVRTQKGSSTSVNRKGVRNGVPRHPCALPPLPHQRLRTLSKNGPFKDQDEVAKRLLSARLMKISELRNALAELQLRNDELQKENRLMKQLQLRHEKALHRYSDTEAGISQLISRHNNEMRVLQEKLRRSQEKERLAERRCTDSDMQLQRCRDQLHKLQQLADDQGLGERDQLARKLTHALVKLQESERKVKELEKKLELGTGSFQRQLASERKKTYYAHQETQKLWQEFNTLSAKLKERERELDTKNIYFNRKTKAASRKDSEEFTSMKDGSRSSSKSVQTEDRGRQIDFSPPPAVVNGSEISSNQADDYLSLKEHQSNEGVQRRTRAEVRTIQEREPEEERAFGIEIKKQERKNNKLRERERDAENEKEAERKQRINSDLSDEKGTETKYTNGLDRDEEDMKTRRERQTKEKKGKDKQPHMNEQEIQANQERAEEERRLKDLLLAKMHEIDRQAEEQDTSFFNYESESACTPPNQHLKEPQENLSTPKAGRRGGTLKTPKPNQDLDLTFGNYAPTFDKPATRAGIRRPSPSQSSGDNNDGLDLTDLANGKKSTLMGQLFGATASSTPHVSTGKMELLNSPSSKSPSSGRRRGTEAPNNLKRTTMHVSKSRPAVRAITALSDDIEEIKL